MFFFSLEILNGRVLAGRENQGICHHASISLKKADCQARDLQEQERVGALPGVDVPEGWKVPPDLPKNSQGKRLAACPWGLNESKQD